MEEEAVGEAGAVAAAVGVAAVGEVATTEAAVAVRRFVFFC